MVNTKNPAYLKVSLCTECNNVWKEIRYKSKEEIESKIGEYLATPIPIQGFMKINRSRTSPSQSSKSTQINQVL